MRAVWGKVEEEEEGGKGGEMKMKEDKLGEEEQSAGQGPAWTTVGFYGISWPLRGPNGTKHLNHHLLPTTRGLSYVTSVQAKERVALASNQPAQ